MRILITGAAAGLAQRVALALAQDGHEVAFTFRPAGTPPDATLELLCGAGAKAEAYPVEFLGEETAVAAAMAEAGQTGVRCRRTKCSFKSVSNES